MNKVKIILLTIFLILLPIFLIIGFSSLKESYEIDREIYPIVEGTINGDKVYFLTVINPSLLEENPPVIMLSKDSKYIHLDSLNVELNGLPINYPIKVREMSEVINELCDNSKYSVEGIIGNDLDGAQLPYLGKP